MNAIWSGVFLSLSIPLFLCVSAPDLIKHVSANILKGKNSYVILSTVYLVLIHLRVIVDCCIKHRHVEGCTFLGMINTKKICTHVKLYKVGQRDSNQKMCSRSILQISGHRQICFPFPGLNPDYLLCNNIPDFMYPEYNAGWVKFTGWMTNISMIAWLRQNKLREMSATANKELRR